jgi:hypothetical protein
VRLGASIGSSTRTPHVVHVVFVSVVGSIIISSRCSSCTCQRDSSRSWAAPVRNCLSAAIIITTTSIVFCTRLYRLHRHAGPLLPPRPLYLICQILVPVPPSPSRPRLYYLHSSSAVSQWQRYSPPIIPCRCRRARLAWFPLHLQHMRTKDYAGVTGHCPYIIQNNFAPCDALSASGLRRLHNVPVPLSSCWLS